MYNNLYGYSQPANPNPYENRLNYLQQMQNTYSAPQRMDITTVSGRNGAEAYQMPPNSRTLLLDETAAIIWLKSTDGAGYPTLTPYKIEPCQTKEPGTPNLEERVKKLEDIINAKSDTISNAKNIAEQTE